MAATTRVAIGVGLPQTGLLPGSADRIAQFAARAEEIGFDSAWVQEDTVGVNGTADPLSLLAIASSSTVAIQLGVAVVILPLHRAVQLAKTAATLDHLSGGRLIVGVGVGGEGLPYELFGVDRRNRGPLVDRTIAELRQLWASGAITPAPTRPSGPSLWIGGHSAAALRRAAAIADGFVGGGAASTGSFARQVELLRAELIERGRPADDYPIAKRIYLALGAKSLPRLRDWLAWYYGDAELARSVALAGDADTCMAGLAEVVRAGARHLILNFVFDEEQQLEAAAATLLARRDELSDEAR